MKKIIYLTLLFSFFSTSCGTFQTSKTVKIRCELADLHSRLIKLNTLRHLRYSSEELFQISIYILESAQKHNINQYIMVAIFDIESRLGRNIIRYTNGQPSDFGWGQIHIRNIKHFGYDQSRLLSDTQYSIEIATEFMAYTRDLYSKRDPEFWARYHSSTPKHRKKYLNLIKLSLAMIDVYNAKPGFQSSKFDSPLCDFKKADTN